MSFGLLKIYYLFKLRWIFAALLGLFSICGELGLLFVEVHGLLTAVDSLIADFNDSTDASNLELIMQEIRGMSAKQLEMLRDNIQIIKKYEK